MAGICKITLPNAAAREGIQIKYNPTAKTVIVSAWYDSFVGIEPKEIPLEKFILDLGIKKIHCERIFEKKERIEKEEKKKREDKVDRWK